MAFFVCQKNTAVTFLPFFHNLTNCFLLDKMLKICYG